MPDNPDESLYKQINQVRVELASKIDSVRTELIAQIGVLGARVDAQLAHHEAEHVAHDKEHERHDDRHTHDDDRHASRTRWAVTSILTGVGVIVAITAAIIAAVRGGFT